MDPLEWLREDERLTAETARREKEAAMLRKLVAALQSCLASGTGPSDEHRALLSAALAQCTPAELETRARLLEPMLARLGARLLPRGRRQGQLNEPRELGRTIRRAGPW